VKIVAVFHKDKLLGLGDKGAAIAANPPLTVVGKVEAHELALALKNQGPFSAIYASRLDRALGTASALSLILDVDIHTIKGLGQHGSKDGSIVYMYPGYEEEGYLDWQEKGVEAFRKIALQHGTDEVVIVVSHRPVLAGIALATRGVRDPEQIKALAIDPNFSKRGYVVFDIDIDDTLVVDE